MKNWKPHIIQLTENPKARERKIDASFFPPASDDEISNWESDQSLVIPDALRSYIATSNGLEAQRGEIWPILPLADWEVIRNECSSPHPWIRFGETVEVHFLLSLGHSPSIYRYGKFGSDEEFFAPSFEKYLELIFRGEG